MAGLCAEPLLVNDFPRAQTTSTWMTASTACPCSHSTVAFLPAQELPSWAVPSSTLRLPPASQAARNRHALLPVQAQPARRTSGPAALPLPLYPEFDATPAQPIDWGSLDRTSSGSLASTSLPSPSAPPMPGGPHPGYQAAVSGELLPRNRKDQSILREMYRLCECCHGC